MNTKKLLLVLLLCVGGVARVWAADQAANAQPLVVAHVNEQAYPTFESFIAVTKSLEKVTSLELNFGQGVEIPSFFGSKKDSVNTIATKLRKYTGITTLTMDFTGQELASDNVKALVNAIPASVTTLDLNVSGNKLGSVGIIELGNALKTKNALLHLTVNIGNNDVRKWVGASDQAKLTLGQFFTALATLPALKSCSLLGVVGTADELVGIKNNLIGAFHTKATKLTLNNTEVQIGDTVAAVAAKQRAETAEASVAQINADHQRAVTAVEARVMAGTLTVDGARAENERLVRDKDAALQAAGVTARERDALSGRLEALQAQLEEQRTAAGREAHTLQGKIADAVRERDEQTKRHLEDLANARRDAETQHGLAAQHARENEELKQRLVVLEQSQQEQQRTVKAVEASAVDAEKLLQQMETMKGRRQELVMLREQVGTMGELVRGRDEAVKENKVLLERLAVVTEAQRQQPDQKLAVEMAPEIAALRSQLERSGKLLAKQDDLAKENRLINEQLAKELGVVRRVAANEREAAMKAFVIRQAAKRKPIKAKIDALRDDAAKKIQHFFRRKLAAKKASTKPFTISIEQRQQHADLQRASHEAFAHKAEIVRNLLAEYQHAGAPKIDQIFEMLLEQEKVHLLKLEGKETTAAQAKVDKKVAAFHADKQVKSQPVKPASPVVKKTGDDIEDALAAINASGKKRK